MTRWIAAALAAGLGLALPAAFAAGGGADTPAGYTRTGTFETCIRTPDIKTSRILHDRQPVFRRNLENRGHIGALTIQVNRNDCLGARRHRCLNAIGINVIGDGIDVHEHRRGAEPYNGAHRGKK